MTLIEATDISWDKLIIFTIYSLQFGVLIEKNPNLLLNMPIDGDKDPLNLYELYHKWVSFSLSTMYSNRQGKKIV